MNARFVICIVLCLIAMLAVGMRPASTPMALVMKAIPEVLKQNAGADWTPAVKSDQLSGGDKLRTGDKGLAILKFLDKSIVRVRERSEVTLLTGQGITPATKVIDLRQGVIGFDVRKQVNEQFRFTSPTSVASIRGTRGKFTDRQNNDTLVVVEGLVNLKNQVSNNDRDIPAGFIGFSGADGSLSSRRATPEELADASNTALGGGENELNLEMKDSKGNKKNLKIKYR